MRLQIEKAIRSTRRRLAIRGEFLRVEGFSMAPTLNPGQIVFVRRGAYRRRAPQRGEVVVARPEACGRRLMIKRLAGLPHDRIELHGRSWQLGDDEFFLLGDDEAGSTDSRSFGPVAGRDLLGPAVALNRPWRFRNAA